MAESTNGVSTVFSATTFVFLDIETNSLPQYTFGRTKITELAMWAMPRNDLMSSRNSRNRRLLTKWTMLFNPAMTIDPVTSEITGLYNDMLYDFNKFDTNAGNAIISYLNQFPKPICLVAHNGLDFDFKIIKKHLEKQGLAFGSHIFCSDSLHIIKELDATEELRFEKFLQEELDLITEAESASTDSAETIKEVSVKTEQDIHAAELNIKCEKLSPDLTTDNELFDSTNSKILARQKLNETTPRRSFEMKFNRNITTGNGTASSNGHSGNGTIVGQGSKARKELFPGVINGKVTKKKTYKLGDIYERLYDCKPLVAHTAEADVETLYRIALKYGDNFVKSAEKNAIPFSEIKTKGLR